MNFEYQRSIYETMPALHNHIFPKQTRAHVPMPELRALYDANAPINYSDSGEIVNNPDWCPWCALFADGYGSALQESALTKATIHFSHSYSNPIWDSQWNFRRMWWQVKSSSHVSSDYRAFVNRFEGNDTMYELSHDDVAAMRQATCGIDNARLMVMPDMEALVETRAMLEFCEQWLGEPDTRVIYEADG